MAIIIAIPVTTVCYILVNVSYLTVLSPQEIISSEAVAEVSPAVYETAYENIIVKIDLFFFSIKSWACKVLVYAGFIIPCGVVISTFGTFNSSIFTAGR